MTSAVLATAGCSGPAPEARVSQHGEAIVGGEPDSVHVNVFGMLRHDTTGVASCSSVLIAPNLLLTARHCVSSDVVDPVVCGQSSLGEPEPPENFIATNAAVFRRDSTWYRVSEVHVPTQGEDTCGYDVALVMLSENVLASVAEPAVPRIDREVTEGERYDAVGYGIDDTGEAGGRNLLRNLSVACDPGSCGFGVRVSEFVGGSGICSGDSGGPALDLDGKVVGVVSRGAQDCDAPVYSSVSAWSDFIREVAAHAAEVGGYTAPFWVASGTSDAPVAAIGDPCALASDCASGATCLHAEAEGTSQGVCVALCSSDSDCAEGNECRPTPDASASVCQPSVPGAGTAGTTNGGSKQLASSSCAFGANGTGGAWSALMLAGVALTLFRRRTQRS